MNAITEKRKTAGVCYAVTDDGIELPVVDLTHPAFQFRASAEELEHIARETLRGFEKTRRLPGFLLRWLARRSILMRGTLQASGSFVSGLTTYLFKLGPENLGSGYAGSMDRRINASLSPLCVRLRLRSMAELLAQSLGPLLASRPTPLHLINIGAGAASDSLNALLLLRKSHPGLLEGRRVSIHALDLEPGGPRFGCRSLESLLESGAPLCGLDVGFAHVPYDWSEPGRLKQLLQTMGANDVVACSSEGGIFEYGSDEHIRSNLAALRAAAPDGTCVVAEFMKDCPTARAVIETGKLALKLRTPAAFQSLVRASGWNVAHLIDTNPLYAVASLSRAVD
ncbi:MAG: hypothetical protein HY898_16635 [Deltaproteobacteria bacterium]|nr:hypothetical protein [Deltaproteobacteria bacterium]